MSTILTAVASIEWRGIETGRMLRARREQRGFTQADVAALVGCHQAQISAYEAGRRRPSAGTLRAMADVLGIAVRVLLGDEGVEIQHRGPEQNQRANQR